MKYIYLLLIAICFVGCKAKQRITETIKVDTTKVATDSGAIKTTIVDTSKTFMLDSVFEAIVFADSGAIQIDPAGAVRLCGVKYYLRSQARRSGTTTGVAIQADSTRTITSKATGVHSQTKQSDTPSNTKATKWYHTAAVRVVSLCCIAAMIYLLFLYIKKKQ